MKPLSIYLSGLLVFLCPGAHADTVAIDYVLATAEANIVPFTVPNPQGGADISIAPSVNLDSGSFESRFFNSDPSGLVSDGDASILGMEFAGELVIVLSSTIEVFGFEVPVSATISGPLTASQQTGSAGVLSGLSLYVETAPGAYGFSAGPLDCNDSALGLFCTAIESVLGAEFPVEGIDSNSALPFAGGRFSDINLPSGTTGSSVTADVDFSFPLADGIEFGVVIDTSWLEVGRMTLIPEPSASLLVLFSVFAAIARRGRRGV